jgi:hypothetical protein
LNIETKKEVNKDDGEKELNNAGSHEKEFFQSAGRSQQIVILLLLLISSVVKDKMRVPAAVREQ